MKFDYDIIVVGGGHAGCEAAVAAARLGSSVLLVTMDMAKFAAMSCNPAVGGVAKGQIVREIDALGGQMGWITDRSTIQFRMLNRSKGAAMWSPRAQCDKSEFSLQWRSIIESTDNLYVWQDSVVSLAFDGDRVCGVRTALGVEFSSRAVVLTAGTFLNGLMHVGRSSAPGGRAGDPPSQGLTEQLVAYGFEAGRMKTGTPARLDGRTIDFSVLIPQYGDEDPSKFSFSRELLPVKDQMPCYLAYTTEQVHDILRTGFDDSPLFNGTIRGVGPRYCPSIEDKLHTFADKVEHQLFLEPEGRSTNEYYLNGFSSSLPWNVQETALRRIKGFENVHFFRPGYAIEYDYFPPTQLYRTLETKLCRGLYFAGQINGTTGYEEAAAQGLMAGINAHLSVRGLAPFVLARDEAYIGVLIDDLVLKGVDEPYRMFTSRAEYRILLRQDNADARLTRKGHELGLVSADRYVEFCEKSHKIEALLEFIRTYSLDPAQISEYFNEVHSAPLTQKRKLIEILPRNEVSLCGLIKVVGEIKLFIEKEGISIEEIEEAEITVKYSGYIEREKMVADKLHRLENVKIPVDFDFHSLLSLSIESRQKLSRIRPQTIGQASRIPGISPADINVLLVRFGR